MSTNTQLYTFGPFELDTREQVLRRDGRPLALKPKVFDLLVVLVENSGRLVHKDELMKQVWAGACVEEGNLAVSIVKLRQALGEARNERRYIETVPRRGYRFVATVTKEQGREVGSVSAIAAEVSGADRLIGKGTIAVLPFKYIGTAGDEYLGLGLADALITRLSNLRQLTVRPTSSIRKYDGADDSVAVGNELRTEWVVDGSVQKAGKRIRVTVQLLNVSDGALRWAEKFDEKFTHIFGVEDSISERVASTLAVKVTGDERRSLSKRYTENTDAYEAYLKGRYFQTKGTSEGCKKAIEYFQKAIEFDRDYALAYVGMAECYVTLMTIFPSREWLPNAERAALKSVALDPELAEAHASLGRLKDYGLDWSGAEDEFRTAISLNPTTPQVYTKFALHLGGMGRFDEALEIIREAQAIDPISVMINAQLGATFYMARRYDEAVDQLRKTLEMDPDSAVAHFILGYTYEAQKKYDDALKEYQESQRSGGLEILSEFTSCVGRLHARAGMREQALTAINELKLMSESRYVQPTFIAAVYSALGDADEAFNWLEKAYLERDEDLCMLKFDPRFDPLRADERFKSLLERIGLGGEDHHASS